MNPKIIVVDDDPIILKRAWSILSEAGMKVAVLKSGKQLLEYMDENPAPDLILMDINMPEMDGFETLSELRKTEVEEQQTPVIFLTANEDEDVETKGLSLGAMDFIKKPFVADVLVLRVRHVVELVRLQRNLETLVQEKTRDYEQLFLHVVSSLTEAIDAKDTYTNGHSGRVAKYAREIARRFGYSQKKQDDIFMMALLHDVGKIGVPDEVIKKPGRLTDDEYESIKKHPSIGGKIIGNIEEMPTLSAGAKWHHERYDGSGYPEGLKGMAIPEAARIIAVADAYDAMSSRRSYRGPLSQDEVRGQIEKGKGTQFDPTFADIMISMIDEDKDYNMCHDDNPQN